MKNSKKIAIATCALCAVMSVSGICAYFTDTDSAVNNFTVGEVKIDLDEPNFPTPPPEDVPPGGEVEKDPQVENTGKNSAYVFIKVAAPKDTFIKAAADGTRIDKEAVLQELFLVKSGDGEFKSLADGYNQDKWELLPDYTDTKSSTEYNYYVFAYKSIVAKGETTATLFDKVKLENAVEGFIDNNRYEININAYAIQSENIPEDTASTLSEIYQVYLNQNPVSPAQGTTTADKA